jgi:serine/threonine protein kinase
MLQAVHVIHEEKIVHSDLKPANFVLVRGQLKLIDFGIANAIANDTTNIQRDHQVILSRSPRCGDCLAEPGICWPIDRYCELHVSRSHRASRWHAAP